MIFGKKKKDEVLDLRNLRRNVNYNKSSQNSNIKKETTNESNNFDFLGSLASSNISSSSNNSNSDYVYVNENYINDSNESPEEKRKKLAKRLLDMTNKIEDLSNQMYHLNQRIEVIEKKLRLNFE